MDLKTYRSNSMAGALAEVKKDLGPDAVILRTRNYKAGGVMGLGGNTVVEITAARESAGNTARNTGGTTAFAPRTATASSQAPGADRAPGSPFDPATLERMRAAAQAKLDSRQNGQQQGGQNGPQHGGIQSANGSEFQPLAFPPPQAGNGRPSNGADSISGNSGASATASDHVDLEPIPSPGKRPIAPTRVAFKPDSERSQQSLEAELASIRELVSDVLRTTRKTAIRVEGAGAFAASAISTNDPLYSLYGSLCDNEVPADIADQIVGEVRNGLDPAESHEPAVIRESALRSIASRIRVVGVERAGDESGSKSSNATPRVQALIGPTGVGKTTTIAKLAASYKLRYGKKVGLITADTYRIAAVDQLRTYAGIIGIPLEVTLAAADIPAAMEKFADRDIVLIDTPGRSPRDAGRLEELAGVLDAIGPARRHLVLSAGASGSVHRSAARCFGAMSPDALIVSKADEAGSLGVLLELTRLTDLPVSYLTTGQEVPDDIEHARADRLARAVLDGGLPA